MIQVRFSTKAPVQSKASVADNHEAEVEYSNADAFTGAIVAGVRHGEGSYTFQCGDVYVGGFENGEFHGKGVYTTEAGDMYEGNFVNGPILGQGNATFASTPNFSSYNGFWVEGMSSGKGKLTFDLGDYYEGQFERGRFHGRGLMVYTNGDAYDGNYVDGNPQGEGQFMFKDSNVVQRRRFANGVDRANTMEIKNSTFSIKKKENLQVKQYKQPEGGKKFFHPKAAKKVDNSSIVAGLLGDLGGKSRKVKAQAAKASKNEKVKKVKEVKVSITTKRKTAVEKKGKTTSKSSPKKKSAPTQWPEYGYSYPKAVASKPVNPEKIFNEIDNEPGLRRTRTMKKTIESARGYFQMMDRLRAAQIAAATKHVHIS